MKTDVRRCPFTLLMLTVLVAVGIYSRTHIGALDTDAHRNLGYSIQLLLEGHLHRLLTSVFFTAGGWRFYVSLAMFAGAVGWCEYLFGTRRAVVTFFGVHVASMLLLAGAVALPLAWLETHRGEMLMTARDVGPSAGYYGCLGLAVASLLPGRRNGIVAAVFLILFARLAWSTMHLPEQGRMMSADLAHLMAFSMGLAAHRFAKCRRAFRSDSKPVSTEMK